MNRDRMIAFFILWGLVLIVELYWLYGETRDMFSVKIIYIVTVIGITFGFGAMLISFLQKLMNNEENPQG